MPFTTPVFLTIFRRPDIAKQLIDAVRVAAPTRIFISCDGPSPERPGEAEKIAANRELIEREIDWPCTIERRYSDINEGPRVSISGAITWFFERVEEGIILEEDCIPHPDFFPYCAELLERYRHDTRVWHISGNNFQDGGQWRGDGSYYFGHIPYSWGWATWRRCWKHYDRDLKRWPALKASGLMETIFEDPVARSYWAGLWDRMLGGELNTWDYQWQLTCLSEGGLTIIPNRNLVANVGFGDDGIYCLNKESPLSNMPVSKIQPLTHPAFILRNAAADAYDFDHMLGGAKKREAIRYYNSFLGKNKLRLQNLFNKMIKKKRK